MVSAEIPTEKGVHYFYKLSAKNGDNQVATSNVEKFVPQGKPILQGFLAVDRINTDGVRFLTEFDPNGGNASYHFEWGPKGSGFDQSTPESATLGFLSRPPCSMAKTSTAGDQKGQRRKEGPRTRRHLRIPGRDHQ